METTPERCFNGTTGEQVPNSLIKQEMEWLAEDTYASDVANQEVDLDMEAIRSIKAEIDPYHTHAEAHAVQEFTPVPQTDEFIKAEFILDDEFRDKMSDSEANCKQLVLPLGDDQQAVGSGSDKEECGSSHTLKGNLNIQMHTKLPDEAQSIIPLECEFRSRTFERKDHFRRPLSTHDEDGNGVSACDLCEKTFSNKYTLKRHKETHAKASTFICEVCGASFTQNGNLKRHMHETHLNQQKSELLGPQTADVYTVELLDGEAAFYGQSSQKSAARDIGASEVCDNIYPKESIRTHMSMAHSKPKHKCEICSRLFKRKHGLKLHLSTHATDIKHDFVCDICERPFCDKRNLACHMKRFAQKEHPKSNCEVCSSSFTKKGDLDVHMATKHLDKARSIIPASQTAEDDDSIDTGTEEFLDAEAASNGHPSQESDSKHSESKSELKIEALEIRHGFYPTHIRLAHSNPNHKCEVCSRVFQKKSDLKVHLKTHDKDRKREFVCHICERAFYEKRMLVRHLKHYGEKDHPKLKCFCGSSFKRKGDLDEHMLTEHSEKLQPIIPVSQTVDHNSINANQISEHRRTKGAPFQCAVCSRFFKIKSLLKKHFRTHSKDRKRDFACELCERKFYHQSGLWTHKKIHHLTPQSSNDTGVPMKSELMTDEEFIDERND